jgi:hypothetical protein
MQAQPVSQLRSCPVDWLWPGRLALGKLAMLDGDPGLGKSLLALDLCARLSKGLPFPDGRPSPGPCNSLILNAEDTDQDTIRPRLQALGADLDRIFVMRQEDAAAARLLRLPTETAVLAAALERSDARLVVLDPVVAFLDSTIWANSDQAVRRALYPLLQLAASQRSAMLLVRHLNKVLAGRSLYRGAGSIGFLGACRSGWLLACPPNQPDQRVLAQVKNNLAPRQPSLAFSVQDSEAGPRLLWHGDSPLSADDLLGTGAPTAPLLPRDQARAFLSDALAEGPVTSRDLWEAATSLGLSERTLYRARQELQIRIERVYRGHQVLNFWLLPDQRVPDDPAQEEPVPDLEEWLAPLRRQFPPATPLDEL